MKSEKYPRLPIARKSRPHLPQAPLRGRQSGSPTGQPYCTLAMSRPMIRLSSRDKSFSHSRTGSRLVADRQNTRGMGMGVLVIHPCNVSKKIQEGKRQPRRRGARGLAQPTGSLVVNCGDSTRLVPLLPIKCALSSAVLSQLVVPAHMRNCASGAGTHNHDADVVNRWRNS
jgi:hypothetical protein